MLYFYVLLSIVLIILAAVTLFRNFISNFNASENLLVNVLIIVLMVTSILFAFACILGVDQVGQAMSLLNSNQVLTDLEKEALEKIISKTNSKLPIYLASGYISFIISFVLLKVIKSRKDNSVSEHNPKWDLDK